MSATRPLNIAVIGATGSIGTQALDIIGRHPELYRVTVMSAGTRVDTLTQLALRHRPALAVIADESKWLKLHHELAPHGIATASGSAALIEAVTRPDVDVVLTATVGYSGLAPTLAAIEAGKDIALANKETLVVAGELVTAALANSSSRLFPVDSEHSAIYQCLVGEDPSTVDRLIITASGGPFRTLPLKALRNVTVSDALHHPNWVMGRKITIDSATMLNKAFEIIEARWLFDIPGERIDAVVHPQSIVHSMVQFTDGAIKAQCGVPDMHLPIAYALGCARGDAAGPRQPGAERPLRLDEMANLTFEAPDLQRFPCLGLAGLALRQGGTTACVINAANEVAVEAFLNGRIPFLDIYTVIMRTLDKMPHISAPGYEDYVALNDEARAYAQSLI